MRKDYMSTGAGEPTRSCPADECKSTQCSKYKSWEPVPDEATNECIEEKAIPGDFPAICLWVDATMKSFEQGSVSKCCRPDLPVILVLRSINTGKVLVNVPS